jgi:uncharacterized protein
MIIEDQSETIAFLQARSDLLEGPVEKIVTHGSVVFLGGERVFKLKRAVRFPYLDFSTPRKRLDCCENELSLNRRTAPEHYLAVRRITRDREGGLAFDGDGALVDAVVEMRRFPDEALFDAMAMRGELTPALMERLARSIADFHAAAEPDPTQSGSGAIEEVIAINERSLHESGLVDRQEAARFAQACRDRLHRHEDLLEGRAKSGKIRRCHGDLILRNIFLFDGKPTLFDCIDFNADLATIDVLYDLAFLLMDLVHRDLPDLANLVFNRYLDESGEDDGASLLPFFMALRATVRAHVGATQAADLLDEKAGPVLDEARAYYRMANDLLQVPPARIIAIGGLSGTGKSSIAARLAGHVGNSPGARILNSDRLRKAAFGVRPEAFLPPEAYAPDASAGVYRVLRDLARGLLRSGVPVIADAVFDRADEREAIASIAAEVQAPFLGIWLVADRKTMTERVEARSRMRAVSAEANPSDADLAVLQQQLARDPGDMDWIRVDAGNRPEAIRDVVLKLLNTPM